MNINTEEANLFVRLLVAHLLADFFLQTKTMVENKNWVSRYMFLHIGIVYILSALFTGWWVASAIIAAVHYIIDGLKIQAQKNANVNGMVLFAIDQLLHICCILAVWGYVYNAWQGLLATANYGITNYHYSLILLGYIFVTSPVSYIIDYTFETVIDPTVTRKKTAMLIGFAERIVILTFVLLAEYEAIGFLIAGKSIRQFVEDPNKHTHSEYVLVGTMMSYAYAIITGVILRLLIF